ncbi:MAG: hypothetical protein CBD97_03915 [Pelagibacteraceae bacterium TMED237]|nr:MAG: hypothetical protein CBD97_03915 [Pelagibacteraceae bacterium TMED237]|tara:strand:- start:11647 stop:12108 length:462 start_codon:yes stop_codon:yes gene_type:complete
MADTSLNENRLSILIWQISNLWQSKIRILLRNSNITFNEYLILETLYNLKNQNNNISQTDICKNSSIDRSVISLKISTLEQKKLINRSQPLNRRSDHLTLTIKGNLLVESLINDVQNQENLIFEKLDSEIYNFTNSLKLLLGKKIRIKAKLND